MTQRNVIRNREIVQDDWEYLGAEDAVPQGAKVIVELARWKQERDELLQAAEKVGVLLKGDDDPKELVEDFEVLSAISLDFPKFADGRCYSHARLLRSRHGWKKDLRAHGDILRDQAFFLWRCGIDVLELREDKDPNDALEAFREFSVTYQPAEDTDKAIYHLR
jgi:uncharacterized protein (DUF934 family)